MSALTPSTNPNELIRGWKQNPESFYRILKIRSKDRGSIRFEPRPVQLTALTALREHKRLKLLKARQLGFTTALAGELFRLALCNRHCRVALVAHLDKSADEIFQIIVHFWESMPRVIREHPEFKILKCDAKTIRWASGSQIQCGTAQSRFWHGQTLRAIHLTEAALYRDLEQTLASITPAVPEGGYITLETTSEGTNQFHRFWFADNGYHPLFFPWNADGQYESNEVPASMTEAERSYCLRHNLTPEQVCWFVKNFRTYSGWTHWFRQFPLSVDEAFQSGGQPYFRLYPAPTEQPPDGLTILHPPVKGHTYRVGVDPAGGSPGGDATAIVVVDINERRVVATYNGRQSPPECVKVIQSLSGKYNQALINVESNNHGLTFLTLLRPLGLPLYRDTKLTPEDVRWANEFGTAVTPKSRPLLLNNLAQQLNSGFEPECPRVKYQLNAFHHAHDGGKAEATSGNHDDLVFALAHALWAARHWKPEAPPPVVEISTPQAEDAAWAADHRARILAQIRGGD